MKKLLIIASLATLMTACANNTPTNPNWRPDMAQANYGKYPTNYPQIIQKWGKDNFDQAATLNYLTMSTPREEYLVTDSEKQQAIYGYSVCVDISGIRSQGAYKPIQKHWFFIRDGKVIESRSLDYGYNRVIFRDRTINCDDAD